MAEARGYRPIGDYAAIGDCHGSALVATDGGIDWGCFGRFDADPEFCRLLDAGHGGYLALHPAGESSARRAYLEDTNILRTTFASAGGEVAVTDFMVLGRRPGSGPNDYVSVEAPGWLVRRIEGVRGEVDVELACRPSIDFGRGAPQLERLPDGYAFGPGAHTIRASFRLEAEGDTVRARVRLRKGERHFVVVAPRDARVDARAVERAFRVTRAFWCEWIAYCRYVGPYAEQVRRSALALKLMTYPPTGACAAALTTSLPEEIGGERNWDYRFCWIRDASLMLHALSGIGYAGEAHGFFRFLHECLRESGVSKLQIMYGVGGEKRLDERSLGHLEGYRGSRPVRAGNGAYDQRQTDLYGYVLEGAYVYQTLGGRLDEDDLRGLAKVAEFIEHCWAEPDSGLWEVRGPPRHFVHSKAMCWVVMDRAIRLLGEREEWVRLRERIREAILAEGRDPEGGHLLQCLGCRGDIDAAALQLPGLGFPLDRETLRATRLAVERELGEGDFLLRYRSADGLAGGEGAFLVCSFWMVDALLAEGEGDAARALFERLLACANDVGLYAEEVDPATREFLGNYPQAFTHLGLVNSAVSLDLFRRKGAEGVAGGYAERAQRSVKASVGWRGVLAALYDTGHVRVISSKASVLEP